MAAYSSFIAFHYIPTVRRIASHKHVTQPENENSATHDLHIFLFLFDDSFVWLQHIEVKYDIEHCYEKILPCMERTYCE